MAGPLGSAPGIILGAGLGAAASVALVPVFEPAKQQAWANNQFRINSPPELAALVAQGAIDQQSARNIAHLHGFADSPFDAMIYLAQKAPDLTLVLELWRRGLLGSPTGSAALGLVDHSLAKAQIDTRYWTAIKDLYAGRLDPAQIAVMVQRSILPNVADPNGGGLILPGQPSTQGSNVPPMPQVNIDPLAEAIAHGIDFDRLAAEARIVGLPASPDLAARMHFRNIITQGAFNQAILEGNTRGEWAPFLLEGFREILTANNYAELELRGFLTPTERLAATDLHGMSQADSDLLYNLLGRSIPIHQVVTGEARGGTFNGPTSQIPPARLQSLQRGNLRPEYYNLADANRYSYPSAFFFRLLLTTGDITATEGEQAFLEIGWSPYWAHKIATALAAQATGAKQNAYVTKAQNQLWTASHKAFVSGGQPRSVIEPLIATFIPNLADLDAIFQLWTDEQVVAA